MLFVKYVTRSLRARLRANFVTVVSVMLFVTGGGIGLSAYLNLRRDLVVAIPPQNIVVMNSGAIAEVGSRVPLEATRTVALLPGIKKLGDRPLAAAELISTVNLNTTEYFPEARTIRGMDDLSIEVHGARIIEGRPPAANTREVMIGAKIAKAHSDLKVGAEIFLPGGPAPITGIFTTGGGPLDLEVWTRRSSLEVHLKAQYISAMTIVADGPAQIPELIAKINGNKGLELFAATRSSLLADEAGMSTIVKVVLLVLILLAVVATSAIAATMSAAILVRLPEFAAMIAIGYRRSRLVRMVMLESVLLAAAGTAAGVIVCELLRRWIGTVPIGYPVELSGTAIVPLVGIGIGLFVGVIGGIAPSIAVQRLDVISTMR